MFARCCRDLYEREGDAGSSVSVVVMEVVVSAVVVVEVVVSAVVVV